MPHSTRSRLRPLRASEILDEAVDLYKQNALLFIGISALLYIPTLFVDPTVTGENAFMQAQDLRGMSGLLISVLWYLMLTGPIVTGALTYAVSERYLDRKIGIKQCFREILKWKVFSSLVLTNLIAVIVVGLGGAIPALLLGLGLTLVMTGSNGYATGIFVLFVAMVSAIIPAYLYARLALAVPSVVLEQNNVLEALRRTLKLTLGRASRIFFILFVVMAVISIIQGLLIAPSSVAMARSLVSGTGVPPLIKVVNAIMQAATSAVLMPASSVVMVLLYFDCRIRDEGFDLHVLAEEIKVVENEKAVL